MPRQVWSEKRERQFKHIKQSEMNRGSSEEDAEEIAARVVNKQRRQSGETFNRTTPGVGNPHQSLKEHSRQELYNRAKELHIKGRSKMTKRELVAAIRKRQ